MRTTVHIVQFIIAGLIVVILGATLGWYVFVHRQIQSTAANDAARGAGIAPSFGSPEGSSFANTNSSEGSGGAGLATVNSTGSAAPRLWQISKSPVAGFGYDSSTTTDILFVERSGGNILEADPSHASIERLTNTLEPKIYDASFAPGHAFLRSVDGESITTFAGTIQAATSTGQVGTLSGVYLPKDIVGFATRSSTEIAYLLANPDGGVMGVTADLAGKNQKRFFMSALSDWQLIGAGDATLYLVQNAADGVPGYSFTVGKSGALKTLIPNVPGLTIAPRASSTALLWSSSTASSLTLYARSSASASAETIPLRTIAEKCAWAPSSALVAYCAVPRSLNTASFLNDRYAGVLHTSDAIWRVDVSAGTAEQFFVTDSTLSLDVEHPQVDPNGQYLTFINASDMTLWTLRIAQ